MKLKKLLSIILVLTMLISVCPAVLAAPPAGALPEGGLPGELPSELPEGGLPGELPGGLPEGGLPGEDAGEGSGEAAEPEGLDLAANLASGAYKWVLSDDGSYYKLAYVTYVEKPVYAEATKADDIKYQQITVFVPAAYVIGIGEDGNLVIDYTAEIANGDGDEVYTAADAPIYFACESPGYSENACSESLGGMSDNSGLVKAGMIVVNVGHRGKGTSIQVDGETVYTGKAPWALVDSKAAIQYLRMNDAYIPGSAERIITSASSGGGALSGMIAATGDYEAYLPYLYEIGAAGVAKVGEEYTQKYSNAVYASNLWCPILNVDYSDAAYEAFYGLGRSGSDNGFLVALNGEMAESFSDYIAAFGFEGIDSYDDFIAGPFCDAVTASANEYLYSFTNGYKDLDWTDAEGNKLDEAAKAALTADEKAEKFLAGEFMESASGGFGPPGMGPGGPGGSAEPKQASPISWLDYVDGAYVITDMDECCADLATAGNKAITGFDGVIPVMTENQPFGDAENNYKHYSAAYLEIIKGNEKLAAAFDEYDAEGMSYTLSLEEKGTAETEGAEYRLTTTTYNVTVYAADNFVVNSKTVTVDDVKEGMVQQGPNKYWGTITVANISTETFENYDIAANAAELAAAGVGAKTVGQIATEMDSYEAWVADFEADVASQVDKYGNNVVDLYNPMNFIMGTDKGGSGTEAKYDTATMAQHWRVRHGTTDANSAPVIATLLNEALEAALAEGKIRSLDFILPWEGPHGTVECASDDLNAWIAEVWEADPLTAEDIEYALDLDNMDQKWTYTDGGWVLGVVTAVVRPVLADYEGVSVCVPGAYVKGIDTDGDGVANVTAEIASGAVAGSLVIDYDAKVTSTNGQVYTAATAPLVLNTGAAGYGDQGNQSAGTGYVKEGYINIACGNRGKQSVVKSIDGETLYYTGDAPSCLVDQKAATRFVKYNILLGNLPGNVDYLVSTGGSGGAAHASMFAATSNNPGFYDYQIEVGAVGVYKTDAGYSTSVTIDGKAVEISDGAWGSIAYSTISSLYEADMTQAFEYYMDESYEFNSEYEKQLAAYLSEAYMDYINAKELEVNGKKLTIEYDLEKYPDTNGYGGSYLDYYLAEFTENLQWYVDNLDYAEGWTWFDEDGNAVESLEGFDKVSAFIEGRYAKAAGGGMGGPGGPPAMPGGLGMEDMSAIAAAIKPLNSDAEKIAWIKENYPSTAGISDDEMNQLLTMAEMFAGGGPGGPGGPGMGGGVSYASFDEMAAAWIADVDAVYEGDRFGKNQVYLYNPLNYIGAEGTADPTWAKIIMGAVEGDIAMMNSMNLQIAWLNAGTDMTLEWQWDGGHVPSEILGDSFALTLDQMYAKHVAEAQVKTIEKAPAAPQANGTDAKATGDDHSAWVSVDEDGKVSFTLADVLAYRNSGASKAVPGFDVENGAQENYVFGSAEVDTRHWDIYVADIFADEEKAAVLRPLYNATKGNPYSDVAEDAWYYEAVIYNFCNGIMNGVGDGKFDPNGSVSRAMAVTVLYRIAGEPEASGTNSFTDLKADWYADAVQWAVNEGITKGRSETVFDPNAAVTRQELATFFYRYAGKAVDADLSAYTDAGEIAEWAQEAMEWAYSEGLITGVSESSLSPLTGSTRAQLATILMRYLSK